MFWTLSDNNVQMPKSLCSSRVWRNGETWDIEWFALLWILTDVTSPEGSDAAHKAGLTVVHETYSRQENWIFPALAYTSVL